MDRSLTVAMQDSSFGANWRPGAGRQRDERVKTGRRSFLGRGAAAAAAAMAAFGGRGARAGNPELSAQPLRQRERHGVPGDPDARERPRAVLDHRHHQRRRYASARAQLCQPDPAQPAGLRADLASSGEHRCRRLPWGRSYISGGAYVGAAGSILAIEARHAGYLNVLLDQIMTYNVDKQSPNFEMPLTADQVVALAGRSSPP